MIRLRKSEASGLPTSLTANFLAAPTAAPNVVAAAAGADRPDAIISNFTTPYLELVRLLRESSEIEHALMVQYLYAAFSIRSDYSGLVGQPVTNGNGLMSIAIQEMQHLHHVTGVLIALGASPNLVSQEFPYNPDIYPFPLELQRMTPRSLAKYVFTEAAAEAVTPQPGVQDPFLDQLYRELGSVRPNHLGSVYARIIELAEAVQANPPFALPDLTSHIQQLKAIKEQGEEAHFQFFKCLFLGQHPGFNGNADVWSLSPRNPKYPSLPVQRNPSAYQGHPHQIAEPETRDLAMLGNLHYWIVLMLLDLSYRSSKPTYLGIAIANHMTGALLTLGPLLARRGAGLPFDPCDLSSATGTDEASNVRILKCLIVEAQAATTNLRTAIGNDDADLQLLSLQDTLDTLGQL